MVPVRARLSASRSTQEAGSPRPAIPTSRAIRKRSATARRGAATFPVRATRATATHRATPGNPARRGRARGGRHASCRTCRQRSETLRSRGPARAAFESPHTVRRGGTPSGRATYREDSAPPRDGAPSRRHPHRAADRRRFRHARGSVVPERRCASGSPGRSFVKGRSIRPRGRVAQAPGQRATSRGARASFPSHAAPVTGSRPAPPR